jgi:hypothetical protein
MMHGHCTPPGGGEPIGFTPPPPSRVQAALPNGNTAMQNSTPHTSIRQSRYCIQDLYKVHQYMCLCEYGVWYYTYATLER